MDVVLLTAGVIVGPELLDVFDIPAGDEIRVLKVAARLLLAVARMGIALPLAVLAAAWALDRSLYTLVVAALALGLAGTLVIAVSTVVHGVTAAAGRAVYR